MTRLCVCVEVLFIHALHYCNTGKGFFSFLHVTLLQTMFQNQYTYIYTNVSSPVSCQSFRLLKMASYHQAILSRLSQAVVAASPHTETTFVNAVFDITTPLKLALPPCPPKHLYMFPFAYFLDLLSSRSAVVCTVADPPTLPHIQFGCLVLPRPTPSLCS